MLAESEVEEDRDLWVDEAGRQWMRTAARTGRWYFSRYRVRRGDLVGTSPVRVPKERHGVWLLLPGWQEGERLLASASFWSTLLLRGKQCSRWLSGSSIPVVVQRQVTGSFQLSPGPSSCVSPRWLLEEFPAFLARAVHWCIIPPGFVSGSYTCCVWVLPVEY